MRERDQHDTVFGEAAIRGAAGRHTWVAGAAYERDAYDPQDVPQFRYAYDVPGIFAQDDVDLASWLSLSAGARVDFHDEYGTFFSPRAGDDDPRRRMDEPLRRRAGLLRGDAADRGDRGGRAHAL